MIGKIYTIDTETMTETASGFNTTIERALNAHDDLVAALQNLLLAVNYRDAMVCSGNPHQMSDAATRLNQAVEKSRAALAKAEAAS